MVKIVTTYLKGRKQADLLKVLQALNVNIVLDVRHWASMPWEYSPHVDTLRPPLTPFKLFLEEHDMVYHYVRDLGYPSKYRKKYKDDPLTAKKVYKTLIFQTPESNQAFAKYLGLLRSNWKSKVVALICSCDTEDPRRCHRFWLAGLFKAKLKEAAGENKSGKE